MKKIFVSLGVISLFLALTACGGGAGSAGDDARDSGSKWDEMKWDEGKWG